MKTNDSGRKTANANTSATRGSRSASADNGSGIEAGTMNRPRRTEAASTAYAMYYVDAAPELLYTTDPAIYLRQRALLTPAGRLEREYALQALLEELVVARWVAKREAERRAQQPAPLRAALQLPAHQPVASADDDDAHSPPDLDRDLMD
ncbi:hypothetical protein [Paraburkholderia terrae]|uniref:hypothetical protein n=1 Tax=Paraburkholderia terrae TaxID=311230 RepID=UPI0033657123